MSGPATRMKLALAAIAEPWDGRFASGRLAANAVSAEVGLRDIAPEQLSVMDAAAEVATMPLQEAVGETGAFERADGLFCLSRLGFPLDLAGERLLLRVLLGRAVERRKEGGS